tara:strand:- start:1068 stop:1868 length:801 start_codon:yes stop_codon:yes gene_type:complete
MISRRLTKLQKVEILEAYKAGQNTNYLAEKYNCTYNTINRTVKTLLTDSEYALLKKNRSKINKKNQKEKKEDLDQVDLLNKYKGKIEKEYSSAKVDEKPNASEFAEIAPLNQFDNNELGGDLNFEDIKSKNNNIDENNKTYEENFDEIEPLISCFSFDQNKQEEDFEILNFESLPESVYMIVDKKVELDLQVISDLPEWSFLPENELKRIAIVLFSNQRTAKRICSRNQRVIKIPNTNVFNLSKSYLISKGITRLILEDSIIGLDD